MIIIIHFCGSYIVIKQLLADHRLASSVDTGLGAWPYLVEPPLELGGVLMVVVASHILEGKTANQKSAAAAATACVCVFPINCTHTN